MAPAQPHPGSSFSWDWHPSKDTLVLSWASSLTSMATKSVAELHSQTHWGLNSPTSTLAAATARPLRHSRWDQPLPPVHSQKTGARHCSWLGWRPALSISLPASVVVLLYRRVYTAQIGDILGVPEGPTGHLLHKATAFKTRRHRWPTWNIGKHEKSDKVREEHAPNERRKPKI